jgi:signal transduction histidine kinase
MMPRLDGFGLLRELRADPVTREVPVILLSARAGEDSSVEGLSAGADDYLVKPFSARELRARVDAQIHRAEMRAMLATRDRQIREMFRLAPVAIAMLRSPGHVFEFVNEEYTRVVGRRGLDGREILEAIPELIDQGIGALLDEVCRSGQPYSADSLQLTLNRGPQGAAQQVYFNFLLQPLVNAAGTVERIAVVAVEVTELARARHDAEAANRAKDLFLAVLGHELRNPLAPILTATRLLELQGPKEPHLQRLRETITRQATCMLKLVEDLLDVGRIITGKLRLEKTRVDVGLLVKQAVEASSSAIERAGHTLEVSAPGAPLYIDADAHRVTQVLSNLLHNAAKFSPRPGRIELTVADNAGTLAIRVRDEGIGIAPEMLERVFDRFVQAAAFDDRTSEGLGIGLSVVRTIVEMHGGSVVARSDGPGKGSEFTVVLPVAAPVSSNAVAAH